MGELEERKHRPFHGWVGGLLHLLGSGRGPELARAGVSKGWDWQELALGLVLALRKWRCPLGQGVMGSVLGCLQGTRSLCEGLGRDL